MCSTYATSEQKTSPYSKEGGKLGNFMDIESRVFKKRMTLDSMQYFMLIVGARQRSKLKCKLKVPKGFSLKEKHYRKEMLRGGSQKDNDCMESHKPCNGKEKCVTIQKPPVITLPSRDSSDHIFCQFQFLMLNQCRYLILLKCVWLYVIECMIKNYYRELTGPKRIQSISGLI